MEDLDAIRAKLAADAENQTEKKPLHALLYKAWEALESGTAKEVKEEVDRVLEDHFEEFEAKASDLFLLKTIRE